MFCLIINYILFALSSKEFVTTLTELNAMAAPAMIGLSSHPVNGYNTPAAIGMPSIL